MGRLTDQPVWSHLVSWAQECAPGWVPVMFPKGTGASGTNWTPLFFKPFSVHAHPWSLWRNGVSKCLQIHLLASGMEPVRLTEADVMCSANAACCEKEAGVWNTHNVLNAYPLPLLLRRPTHHSQAARRHQRLPWPMGHIMNALSTSRAMMGLWPLEMQNQWLQRNLQTNILTTRFCLFQNEFCICFLFVCQNILKYQ